MDHDEHAHHHEGHAPETGAVHDHSAHDHSAHDHAAHTEHAHAPQPAGWGTAVSATLHCLTGCAVGEILGMVIGTALGWHGAATIVLAIALAFVFGYAFTMRGLLRGGMAFKQALKIALAADTVSIAVMEVVDNAFMLAIPGAMEAGLADARFWIALAAALALAFVLTVPVNRWLISRGKGHAVVHAHHQGH
ncbi:DUF4396 domain-containing protein [Glycomyces paridis]|uniref:DUF4396 domain-containing protein n=1 Tax=Glycomyces paridis TaxID=2126555 RepID=A0A4S8P6Q4_9ACTN|nr:DUF4396 domain-containing protein [Glycomyces paridis]THV23459.1 DUF4396 domain-containing protein [Glycomyces paridis]